MEHRRMGTSQLMAPPVSVGCWSFGGGAEDYWGAQDQGDVNDLVAAALDGGADLFDTAYGYNDGRSEESLGIALRGKRGRALICTKTPIMPSAEAFEAGLTASLKRLGTDYVDMLMIHWPTRDLGLMESNLLALGHMCKKGYVRYAGVSNFGVATMAMAKDLGVPIVANEFAYSLISRGAEAEIIPYCTQNGIGIASYMTLMQGILTGKYASIEDIPPRRRRTVQFETADNPFVAKAHATPSAQQEVLALLGELRRLAPQAGLTPGQLAIAWCVNKPGVATAFIGCRDRAQLEDNLIAARAKPSAEIMAALDAASQPVLDKMGAVTDIFGQDRIW